ncbi:MAG TPA: cytochrome c [Burkholderiales bacterium]|nr:cytochrome c [Burkholderiales bacterium]
MKVRTACALLGLLAAVAALAQEHKAVKEPLPAFDKAYLSNRKNVAAGKDVWDNQCRHCHGAAAYPGKAPKLNPGQLAPDFIYERVTYGFGKMPAWKDVFSLEQRKSVVAYIKSRDFSP